MHNNKKNVNFTLSINLEVLKCGNIGHVINLRGTSNEEPPHLIQYPSASGTPCMYTQLMKTYSKQWVSKYQCTYTYTLEVKLVCAHNHTCRHCTL